MNKTKATAIAVAVVVAVAAGSAMAQVTPAFDPSQRTSVDIVVSAGTGLAYRVIYWDANGNGQFDPGEPVRKVELISPLLGPAR